MFVEYARNHGSLVVLGSSIYLVDGRPAQTGGDRLEINGLTWPLLKVDADSLWTTYAHSRRQEIEGAIEKKLRDSILQHGGQMLSAALGVDAKYAELVRTALFKIGPYFIERKADEGQIDDGVSRETIIDYLESRLGSERADFDLRNLVKPHQLEGFGKALGRKISKTAGSGIACLDNKVYTLQKGNRNNRFMLHAGRKYPFGRNIFTPYREADLPNIDAAFDEYFSKFVDAETSRRLEERMRNFDPAKHDIRELRILAAVLRKGTNADLDLGGWGIVLGLDDGVSCVTIYLKVPEYAMRDWKQEGKHYYLFPESKVAVSVYKEEHTKPFLLGKAYSPFVIGGHRKDGHICMGAYDIPALPFPSRVAKYLLDAKKVITSGYTKSSAPHVRLYDPVFDKLEISRDELRRRGIPITNE